jgi:thioredoxin reductase
VLVVGAGQAGLECAGLAARAGAEVEVVARSGVRWFADREPHHERGRVGSALYRLAYPAVGYGPPPLNRLVLYPDLFAALPRPVRQRLTRRLLRPGGSPWVRRLCEGKVSIVGGAGVVRAARRHGAIHVVLSEGSEREVDEVLLATGYRFSLERLDFLDRDLRGRIGVDGGWPVLDRTFESTVPGLFFAGYAAEDRFGPLSRFVLGADFTARRLRAGVARRVGAGKPGAMAPGR